MFKDYNGFLRYDIYDPDIFKDIMDEDELQNIIDEASKVTQIIYSKKRLADNQGIKKYKFLVSISATLLVFSFMLIVYHAILTNN